MSLPRISFDIDGTLADFTGPFSILASRLTGRTITPAWPCYDPRGEDQLFSREEWAATWEQVFRTDMFWASLPVLAQADLSLIDTLMLSGAFLGYFVTRRPDLHTSFHADAGYQTLTWLAFNGVHNQAGIVCQPDMNRVEVLKALRVDHHLDDLAEQFLELRAAGIDCWLIDQPWNRHIDAGPYRVSSTTEFLSKVLGMANPAVPGPTLVARTSDDCALVGYTTQS